MQPKTLEEYMIYKYRVLNGFNPDKPMTIKERLHWASVNLQRKLCLATQTAHVAVECAPVLDKQYFLAKWWNQVDIETKKTLLEHTWRNKMDGYFYGLDWWLPYFKEVGFITNCDKRIPTEPITLYRGTEPFFRQGMSWTSNINMAETFANTYSLFGDKFIYGTVVQPDSILGIFKGNSKRGGLEYVINHQHLNEDMIEEVDMDEYIKQSKTYREADGSQAVE